MSLVDDLEFCHCDLNANLSAIVRAVEGKKFFFGRLVGKKVCVRLRMSAFVCVGLRLPFHFLPTFLMLCLNFNTAKLISMLVSFSFVTKSSSSISAIILWWKISTANLQTQIY